MSYSNSSLNTFTACMKKYEHQYILHTKPDIAPSVHLTFGSMAHDVLYKSGQLRDASADGVVQIGEYYPVIPSEVLYPDLKETFKIQSWQQYFVNVIKEVYNYEKQLIDNLEDHNNVRILREQRVQLTPLEASYLDIPGLTEPLVGIIDLLILTDTSAIIIDYKFSTKVKTQDNFDMDSQLYMYALFVHTIYNIPLHNIQIGYIDIPKQQFDTPIVLSNGTLSRSKSQNVAGEFYKKAVEAIHGKNDPVYNCEKGGHYYDTYLSLSLNRAAYLNCQYLDVSTYNGIIDDVVNTVKVIEKFKDLKLPFLRKYDAYTCSRCEFKSSCKPWMSVNFD